MGKPDKLRITLLSYLQLIARQCFANARGFQQRWRYRKYKTLDNQTIFSKTYSEAIWGKESGLCSGFGSRDESLVDGYCSTIQAALSNYDHRSQTIIDLGCGDYAIGSRISPHAKTYIGVDVVPDVIKKNNDTFGQECVIFKQLDIVRDPLPDGDICLIRQVLQHLTNDEIGIVLRKVSIYKEIYVTEHLPPDDLIGRTVNRDKIKGPGIRLFENSGVYPDQPPFNWPKEKCKIVHEVRAYRRLGYAIDPGILRTYHLTVD